MNRHKCIKINASDLQKWNVVGIKNIPFCNKKKNKKERLFTHQGYTLDEQPHVYFDPRLYIVHVYHRK